MNPPTPQPPEEIPPEKQESQIRIYFWPNLMTGGNLLCGFIALTRIVEAEVGSLDFNKTIQEALGFILLACIFDLLDGRVARMGGRESPFGREFDSLADLISFGVAPAFLVHRVVLREVFDFKPELGWFIASVYLICGAFRLARFNCIAALQAPGSGGGKEFQGFPIPAAAALVASLTLFQLWWESNDFPYRALRYFLPFIMLFLSFMMVSQVKYPSFKNLDLRATRPFTRMVLAVLFVGYLLVMGKTVLPLVLPALLTCYLIYGFIRPKISMRMRREFEEEDGED